MIGAFMLFAFVTSMIGAVKARRIRERWRVRRRLRLLPEITAAIAEGTEVRIAGVVRVLDEALAGPLTGWPCVLYRVRVVRGGTWVRSRMARVRPSRASRELFALRPFVIDRGEAGVVVVDGEAAELDLPSSPRKRHRPDLRDSAGFLFGLPPREDARFDEIVLTPGTAITVVGFAMLDIPHEPTSHERGFRDTAPPRLRITGTRARPLTISRGV